MPASLRAVLLGGFVLFAAAGAAVVDDYGASGDIQMRLERHPGSDVHVNAYDGHTLKATRSLFPPQDRARPFIGAEGVGDYHVSHHSEYRTPPLSSPDRPFAPLVYSRQVRRLEGRGRMERAVLWRLAIDLDDS